MKRVAISQRVDIHHERGERRDALDQRWAAWLGALAILPLPVPNHLSEDDLNRWLLAVAPDGIVLSGGNDWGECAERDRTELALLAWAETMRRPVLGICRGFQVMSIQAGVYPIAVSHHVGRHLLVGDVPGVFSGREVNSYHSLGIHHCPDGYAVLARASDGVVEAIRHASLPWEGWMWHPERESVFDAGDLHRAQTLFGGHEQ